MWEPLTATAERINGPNAAQRVEAERAAAWAYYINGGGGEIAYFDGYKWHEIACRHIADDEERRRERSR
ncbi:hypothetical protein ACWAT4_37180 [Bradyrhizobium manausense]